MRAQKCASQDGAGAESCTRIVRRDSIPSLRIPVLGPKMNGVRSLVEVNTDSANGIDEDKPEEWE